MWHILDEFNDIVDSDFESLDDVLTFEERRSAVADTRRWEAVEVSAEGEIIQRLRIENVR